MGCCDSQPGLIPFEEALQRLVSSSRLRVETETVSLRSAVGRVLASSPVAAVSVPPADNSGMDGYALNYADLNQGEETRLPVSLRIPAGCAPGALQADSCARIFTGAEIPAGADTVVMQENTRIEGDQVVFPADVKQGSNVRRAGQDIMTGDSLLTPGTRLQPADLGVLASVGLTDVEVYRPLRVAVLSTGDELVEPGIALQPGQIYNSNRFVLSGLLQQLAMELVDLGCVEDTLEATLAALTRASEQADVIVSTGGVSVGEEDHVKSAVEQLGQLDLWKIKIKPGKPVAYGRVADTPFIGLPGNPTSSFITFCLLARPALLTMQGVKHQPPLSFEVEAGFTRSKPGQRQEFLRVKVDQGVATPFSNQSSGVLSSASWANGVAVIPPETTITEGDAVSFIPFSELLA